jgi:predicted GNAT family acetyltransferase
MTDPAPQLSVQDNPAARRYEITLDGEVVGISAYIPAAGRIVFTHTEIDEALEGQGIGSRLARDALDDVRARGLRVTARCPFIAGYIKRHPEYQDLLTEPSGG